MKEKRIPNHIAIILDGNGRWAKERGLNRSKGHDAGYKNLKKLCPHVFSTGIKVLSMYAFSTDNFKRSKEEVDHLMNLFVMGFKKDKKYFKEKNIKIIFSGERTNLRDDVLESMDNLVNITKDNTGGILNICLNYGGRSEIVDAVKGIISDIKLNKIIEKDITEDLFGKYLYHELPDVDYLIRTSGENRISNFLLWQISYAEFYFPEIYFPDFNENEFDKAMEEYYNRDRRFGGINPSKEQA